MELGCTDLHLACDDTVLVTQVVDDVGDAVVDLNTVKVKRLQVSDHLRAGSSYPCLLLLFLLTT